MYASGKGISQDYATSLSWYQKAAEKDLPSAQYNLGLMYENGMGTTPDKAKAQEWFHRAAAHNFAPARNALEQTG